MDRQRFNELCQLGEQADLLVAGQQFEKAQLKYSELKLQIEKEQSVNMFLVSKATLGTILINIRLGNLEQAMAIWNADAENSLFGLGIYGLEHAQVALTDLVLYDFICAYLHSITAQPPAQAARAINQYLSRIGHHAIEQGDRALLKVAIGNWKQHLKSLFPTGIPQEFARELIVAERQYGEIVPLMAIQFPAPAAWQKPKNLEEPIHQLTRKLRFENPREQARTEGALARKPRRR